jgi:hypothetical protein
VPCQVPYGALRLTSRRSLTNLCARPLRLSIAKACGNSTWVSAGERKDHMPLYRSRSSPSYRWFRMWVCAPFVPVVTFALVLIPSAASALCVTEPFDRAVGRSDAVLVGTIVSARSRTHRIGPERWGGHGGVLVRIDVEDVLKGSAEGGDAFILGSCAPPVGGPDAQRDAWRVMGYQGVYSGNKRFESM